MRTIERLPLAFEGKGEVKGFTFTLETENETHYLYKVSDEHSVHYELFLKKETPICVDFENRIYSDIQFKHVYPKSKDFGVWAWTFKNKETAIKRMNQ